MPGTGIHRPKLRGAHLASVALACLIVPIAAQGASGAESPPTAPARAVVNKPKPGAIADAIAAVAPGGTVRIKKGHYRESLLIEKPVKLIAAGKGRPTIDGRCEFPAAVSVRSGGVTLKGLKIVGGREFASVDFAGVPNGRANDLRVRNTCEAEYGINVFSTGAVDVTNNRATGFEDAGIYVGGITSTPNGTLFVGDNVTYGNNKGVIVEDSSGGDIAVFSNEIRDNNLAGVGEHAGIFVNRSDGVRISTNRVQRNGSVGLLLTADSDNNLVTGNVITDNPTDVRNEGAGNCGSGNTFATGGPLSPC